MGMFSGEEQSIFTAGLQKWGESMIHNQVGEEMGELLVAFNHCNRGRANITDVVEELCDVLITAKASLWAIVMAHEEIYGRPQAIEMVEDMYKHKFSKYKSHFKSIMKSEEFRKLHEQNLLLEKTDILPERSILGYANPRDAIARHVDSEDVVKHDTLTASGSQPQN